MIILQLAIILMAAKLAGNLSVRFGQPSVLGEIIVGILLGPSVFGLISATDTLSAFSQIGVILLMFMAGLETDMDEFKRSGKASTFVGLGGIIVPLVLGYFAGIMMDLTSIQSWFLGLLLSATSVSISVQALKEMNQLCRWRCYVNDCHLQESIIFCRSDFCCLEGRSMVLEKIRVVKSE
jgi:Kef-type K+ transport system membrane component KefB